VNRDGTLRDCEFHRHCEPASAIAGRQHRGSRVPVASARGCSGCCDLETGRAPVTCLCFSRRHGFALCDLWDEQGIWLAAGRRCSWRGGSQSTYHFASAGSFRSLAYRSDAETGLPAPQMGRGTGAQFIHAIACCDGSRCGSSVDLPGGAAIWMKTRIFGNLDPPCREA